MSATAPQDRWLFGAVPDLLLGCGVAYLASFALLAGLGSGTLEAWLPGGLLVMLVSLPHYGGTLLRVYERREERQRYRLFAIHASAALALAFVVGLRSPLIGSIILTVYLTWSPWHYTGQNYGVFLMLARRRGVRVDPGAKRWLYASFILSYALTFCAIHGGESDATYAPVVYGGTAFHALSLGIPQPVTKLLIPALAAGYLASLAMAARLLLRGGSARALAPGAVLVVTQASWFAVPVAIRHWVGTGGLAADVYTAYGFLWIAGAHAAQYLWVTTYFARSSGRADSNLGYLGRAALAGYAIWIVPGLLFAPGLLGDLPYESGLALLVASVVNLHHFVLDGAIWKLRDGRVARILLRPAAPVPEGAAAPRVGLAAWAPRAAAALGAVSIGVAVLAFVEEDFGFRRAIAERDFTRARTAISRLRFLGREGPSLHERLGSGLLAAQQPGAARTAFEESLALRPSAEAWIGLGSVAEASSDFDQALRAYDEAIALDPGRPQAHYRRGVALLARGEPAQAQRALERAAELAPDEPRIRLTLERARRARARVEAPSEAPEPDAADETAALAVPLPGYSEPR